MNKQRARVKIRSHRNPVRLPSKVIPRVSVIIPVMNEAKTLARVIRQAFRVHPKTEVIVIINGSSDTSAQVAARAGARVFIYGQPLGHDVGRSVGAKEARGEVILFLDGDFVIPARDLVPFVKAVLLGKDVALNSYSGKVQRHKVHRVVLAKHALNTVVARADLRGASMTTIPHAISRKALEVIGAEALAVPPLAQTIAIKQGLRVKAVHFIPVGSLNPIRRGGGGVDPIGDLILGDHLEAIHWYTQATDDRASFSEYLRNRGMMR